MVVMTVDLSDHVTVEMMVVRMDSEMVASMVYTMVVPKV